MSGMLLLACVRLLPAPVWQYDVSVLGLMALGTVAWTAAHRLGRVSFGAVSFIPWLAAILVSPTAVTVALVGCAAGIGELTRGRATTPLKAVFNVSQYVAAFSMSALVFVAAGGRPVDEVGRFTTLPFVLCALTFFVVNGGSVAAVLALSKQSKVRAMWNQIARASLVNDLLSLPVIFLFAIVAVKFGIAGVVTLGAVMFGVRRLYALNSVLETTNRELLEVLVDSIELRDPYTSGHSQRVAEKARIVGKSIGLSAKQLERLSIAALLHDVGKTDQRFSSILSKPGRLTEDERLLMETHPDESADLIQKVSELSDIVLPVRHHHESWDGSGYPARLAGDAIPLFSRVIALADTVDAMLTDRPYRSAMSREAVMHELKRCSGSQFDPAIVDSVFRTGAIERLLSQSERAGEEQMWAPILPRRAASSEAAQPA
jgi:HD-GYP domain-containing protein (c-di-GMP phosphodiesterase class II)